MGSLINISSITSKTLDKLGEKVSTYFFGEAKEQDAFDIKLDIIGEETLTADCDVTDYYVESNTAYQDQISLKPKIYTVSGEVGNLVWYQSNQDEQGLGQLAQRLEGVVSFLPVKSKSFNQMKSKVMKGLQWVDTASNVLSKFNTLADEKGQDKQTSVFAHLCGYRDDRKVLNIKTPWGVLKNYVILNLKFSQPKETKDKTLISITFKELKITELGDPVPFDPDKYQGNALFENQPEIDEGTVSGEDVSLPSEDIDVDEIPLEHSLQSAGSESFTEYKEVEVMGDKVLVGRNKGEEWKAVSVNLSNGETVSPDSPQGSWVVGGLSQESIKRRIANAN